jgi:hypothetical protein
MSFEKLLDDLETLQKSFGDDEADDKKIQAAEAGEGKDEDEDEEAEAKKAAEADKDKDGKDCADEGKPFGKSMALTDAEGNPVDAVDATEFVKALNDQVGAIAAGIETDRGHLTKSIETLTAIAVKQNEMIKSLRTEVAELANQGRGRKSVTAPTEDMAKGGDAPLNAGTLMAKANAAYDAGRISGKELTVVDVALRYGHDIDPSITNRIMAR